MREKRQKTIKANSLGEYGIMNIENILQELKKELKNLYSGRLKKLILYGSYARNEAWKDSDIDIVVLLDGEVLPGKEIERMIDIITDLNLKHNVLLSVYPTSEKALQKIKSPLLLNIQREGVPI